jgi:hypothetical protein
LTSFNANNGSGTIAPIGGETGKSIALPASGFSRGGKILAGWNTQAGGGTACALGASRTINGSAVLYAVRAWTNAGTTGDPPLIYDAAGLAEITNDNTAHYKLENGISISGTWKSPCDAPYTFMGTFDGNGHTVHFNSVTITGPDTGEAGFGLFGNMTQPGVIENLKAAGNISATRTGRGSRFYPGGIAGWTSQTPPPTIQNRVSAVDVTAEGEQSPGSRTNLLCSYKCVI